MILCGLKQACRYGFHVGMHVSLADGLNVIVP